MRIPNKALVLVADGSKYLFLRNEGTPDRPALKVEAHAERPAARTSAQGTDSPGRAFSSVGGARSALDQTDFHQLDENRFAAETAALLCRRARNGDFDALIVTAPPRTLGELRRHYERDVTERLVAEVDKDLTGHPVSEIEAILAD